MGTCFSDDKSASTINKTTKDHRSIRDFEPTQLIIDINPQNLQETQVQILSPCPTIISLPSSVQEQPKVKSMISLEDALMNQNGDIEECEELSQLKSWMESHNVSSSLMKMTKSKIIPRSKVESSRQSTKSMINRLENCDNVSASLHVNQHMSSIVFSSVYLDIEFVLPKGRAGPLVVPYICYEKYPTKKGQAQQ